MAAGVAGFAAGLAMMPCATAGPPPASHAVVLPLDEVQAITRGATLAPSSLANGNTPWVDHSLDAKESPPCRRVMNQDEKFDRTWSNFTTVGYTGASNIGVRQSVAAYPDAATTQQAYDRLTTAERECHDAYPTAVFGSPPTLTVVDVDTLLVQTAETVNGPGSAELLHRHGQLVIDVSTSHYSTDPKIARIVLAHIVERIS